MAPNFLQADPATRPIPLRPDNFTQPARTPWGGRRLVTRYKADLLRTAPEGPVGESWELSVTPELPSATPDGTPLAELLARDPGAMLGDEAAQGRDRTALLVKWLDADENLSLQIHPPDDYPALTDDQSGKPESWYVVATEPGAGLFLGFRPETTAELVREVLASGGDLSALMAFVPVRPGDFAALDPGTPHAIGAGVTLIEPQLVLPGKRGVTYRYWDWNRRYDAYGRRADEGQPRALHLEHALAVTDWGRATDPAALATRRASLGWPTPAGAARCEPICGPEAACPVASEALRVCRLVGRGRARMPDWNVLRAVTVIEGSVTFEDAGMVVNRGATVAVPAAAGALQIELTDAHAVVSAVGPG
jgi:mannose-6-phosphate isomerase